jgi:hypothetical protein
MPSTRRRFLQKMSAAGIASAMVMRGRAFSLRSKGVFRQAHWRFEK